MTVLERFEGVDHSKQRNDLIHALQNVEQEISKAGGDDTLGAHQVTFLNEQLSVFAGMVAKEFKRATPVESHIPEEDLERDREQKRREEEQRNKDQPPIEPKPVNSPAKDAEKGKEAAKDSKTATKK